MTAAERADGGSGVVDQDSETLRRAIALVRALRDPALPGLVVMLGVAVAGAITLVVTVFGIADARFVPLQVPHLLSGGIGGAALVAVGALLAAVQSDRRDRARARSEMRELVHGVGVLVHRVGRTRCGGNDGRTMEMT